MCVDDGDITSSWNAEDRKLAGSAACMCVCVCVSRLGMCECRSVVGSRG